MLSQNHIEVHFLLKLLTESSRLVELDSVLVYCRLKFVFYYLKFYFNQQKTFKIFLLLVKLKNDSLKRRLPDTFKCLIETSIISKTSSSVKPLNKEHSTTKSNLEKILNKNIHFFVQAFKKKTHF